MKTFKKITDSSVNIINVDYGSLTATLEKNKCGDLFHQEMKFKSVSSLYDYTKTLVLDGYSIIF